MHKKQLLLATLLLVTNIIKPQPVPFFRTVFTSAVTAALVDRAIVKRNEISQSLEKYFHVINTAVQAKFEELQTTQEAPAAQATNQNPNDLPVK